MSLLTHIVDCQWMPRRAQVRNEAPFTGRRQISELRFHRWEFLVTYAKVMGADANAKIAALRALRGGTVSFDFRDPSRSAPASGYTGTGTIDTSASGYSIPVKDLDASTLIAKAGDMMSVQIDSQWQLFTVTSDVTSTVAGLATIAVDNPVRGSAADGDSVRFNDWLVTCTIEEDERWNVDKNGVLQCEAIKFIEDF